MPRTHLPARLALAALLALGCGGCASGLGFLHPVQPSGPGVVQRCQAMPPGLRERTHVFFVNGLDPLYVGNLNGLCDRVRAAGFPNATCGQMWHASQYREHIRQLRRADPAAKIALVGYSGGALCVRRLAHQLHEDGVGLDLLVYLGGDFIRNEPSSRPANVGRVVNITGRGFLCPGGNLGLQGCDLDGADNRRLAVRHLLLPSRAETADALLSHLCAITSGGGL